MALPSQADFKKAVVTGTLAKKPRFTASVASDVTADWFKLGFFGPPGSGKTFFLLGPLLAGERVFVITTDFGGNGLRTIKEELRRRGKPELLDNLANIDISDWKSLESVLDGINDVMIGGEKTLWQWRPTMFVLEGMSNAQMNHLDDYVLGFDGGTKASEARAAGIDADERDWGRVRREMVKKVNTFLFTHNPDGTFVHKVITFYEGEPKEDKITKEIKPNVLLQGGIRSFIGGAFDAMIRTRKLGGKHIYEIDVEKTATKNRGLDLLAQEPGDPLKLWLKITGKGSADASPKESK
jgi:hypothetical protein